jgi:peptidoglycan/LPS O-acetylase OafA/YrhL
MSLLNWNHKKVQNLTPWEIWFFILGRVLLGFGLGVLAMQNYPRMFGWSGPPLCGLGALFLLAASKGFARKDPNSN